MKKLLALTLIVVTFTFAGILHGNAIHYDVLENISLSEAYKHLYTETMSFDMLIHYTF